MTEITEYPSIVLSILLVLVTIVAYQFFAKIQNRLNAVWFNPMLLSIIVISFFVLYIDMPFEQYFQSTKILNNLLEPAVVALGYPLYQQLHSIKHQWKAIALLLTLGVLIVIPISLFLTMLLIALPEIAVSLSLKSVTTPIGISLTEALNGNNSITAFAIIIAGLSGALLGPTWLNFINVKSPKAHGLAIGAASHALGTATISKLSYEHSAYGSLALILSAVITAILSPILIPFLFSLLG
jgi:predicted murein hydrolase (TIGR00659 family)